MNNETHRTRKRVKKRKRPIVLGLYIAFWAAVFIMFTALFINQTGTYNDLRAQLTRLDALIEAERAEVERRELQLSFFDSDAYVEELARNRGMAYPTEIVFRIITD